MAEVTTEELATLQREFDWLLSQEVPAVLSQLREAVTECASKFPVPVGSHNADRPNSSDKFVLTTTDQLKVVVTLTGDSISAAEINLKLPRPHAKDAYHNTGVREDVPWKLQQVQDAANHLHMASESLQPQQQGEERTFSSAAEVTSYSKLTLTLAMTPGNCISEHCDGLSPPSKAGSGGAKETDT